MRGWEQEGSGVCMAGGGGRGRDDWNLGGWNFNGGVETQCSENFLRE